MRSPPLFQGTFRNLSMTIGRAAPEDLAPIERPIPLGVPRDLLQPAMLVAIRGEGLPDAAVHVVAWRQKYIDVWATSPLQAINLQAGIVVTSSRSVYAIPDHGDGELLPMLHRHLEHALRVWGFEDVRAP